MKIILARFALPLVGALGALVDLPSLRRLERRLRLAVLRHENLFEWRAEVARSSGVKIGKDCLLFTTEFSTEPYLIEIGDHVVIGSGTQLITHDGGTWVFDDLDNLANSMNVYGRIKIGNNVFIGMECIILCNVEIGDNCVIGAGSVVRSDIPPNSVAAGNPAKVVLPLSMYETLVQASDRMMRHHPWDETKHAEIKKKFGAAG